MAEPTSENQVREIRCPACRSTVTSDGKTLVESSGFLDGLKAKAERLQELKEEYAELKARLKKLQAEIDAADPQPAPAPEPTPGPTPEPEPAAEDDDVVIRI